MQKTYTHNRIDNKNGFLTITVNEKSIAYKDDKDFYVSIEILFNNMSEHYAYTIAERLGWKFNTIRSSEFRNYIMKTSNTGIFIAFEVVYNFNSEYAILGHIVEYLDKTLNDLHGVVNEFVGMKWDDGQEKHQLLLYHEADPYTRYSEGCYDCICGLNHYDHEVLSVYDWENPTETINKLENEITEIKIRIEKLKSLIKK